jgi:hypothetical protein
MFESFRSHRVTSALLWNSLHRFALLLCWPWHVLMYFKPCLIIFCCLSFMFSTLLHSAMGSLLLVNQGLCAIKIRSCGSPWIVSHWLHGSFVCPVLGCIHLHFPLTIFICVQAFSISSGTFCSLMLSTGVLIKIYTTDVIGQAIVAIPRTVPSFVSQSIQIKICTHHLCITLAYMEHYLLCSCQISGSNLFHVICNGWPMSE